MCPEPESGTEGCSLNPFAEFVAAHKGLSREEFLTRVTTPHVVLQRDSTGKPPVGGRDSSFLTVRLDKAALEAVDLPTKEAEMIAPVEKRADGKNAFGMMITMGRAQNNDIVIPDQRVSKFHAYFRQQGEAWFLCDANSRNGTFLDGEPVPQQGGSEVMPGARIRLAKALELLFYDPSGLFDRVQQS